MSEIIVDEAQLQSLKEKYPSVSEKQFDSFVKGKCQFYSNKSQEELQKFGFKEGKKQEFFEKIKEMITFIQEDYVPYAPTIKKEILQGTDIFTLRGQLERFYEQNPFYYDTSKIFYRWIDSRWVISDEVDFLNLIYENFKRDTLETKNRIPYVEGLKQVGRKHKPKKFEKTWVQFQDKIYDVKTGNQFEASPEYFGLNPIPWRVGESEETPMINKLFHEWVDEKWVPTLYEIVAYCVSPNKFLQRIIALTGGGSNGKGTFIKLLCKFLGEDNYVSTQLRELSENRFEPAVLFGKLLAIMGEVSSNDLKNTNQIKQLSGEDKISFQFKGKTPFTADNTATMLCATNSLPITPDKSQGFYRRWLIIDFPNQFKQLKEDLISKIPNEEFENLAKKCIRILKELYLSPVFSNEGDFEEREKRFEERSNPVKQFLEDFCQENEEIDDFVTLKDFSIVFNQKQRKNNQRVWNINQISKLLREEGFQITPRKDKNGKSNRVILNLSLKTTKTTKTTEKPNWFLRKKSSSNSGSSSSSSSNSNNSQSDDFEDEKEEPEDE